MQIDFGYITEYKPEKGFGFVSLTIRNKSREKVLFHIRNMKGVSQELASKIESNSSDLKQISFWYQYECDPKPKTSKIWLSSQNIPDELQNELILKIEDEWRNNKIFPERLRSITIDLLGEARMEQLIEERAKITENQKIDREIDRKKQLLNNLEDQISARKKQEADLIYEINLQYQKREKISSIIAQKQKELNQIENEIINKKSILTPGFLGKEQIEAVCKERQIQQLIHFTHKDNLRSILTHGLLGRSKLDQFNFQRYKFNDEIRLDNQRGAVCLSVTFPNYKMFFKYSSGNKSEWVVLCLDVFLLWELDCKFYVNNAASGHARQSEADSNRKSAKDFKEMFSDLPHKTRNSLNIPENYTTDPQAEILVLEPVPVKYIKSVDFYNENIANSWLSANQNLAQSFTFYYSDRFFRPRKDYEHWRGKSPVSSHFFDISFDSNDIIF